MLEELINKLKTNDEDRDSILRNVAANASEEGIAMALYALEEEAPRSMIFLILIKV